MLFSHTEGGETVLGTKRLLFPLTLEAYVSKAEVLTGSCHFHGTLSLVGGHAVALAWYLSMYQAISSNNIAWCKLLWQCALTVSVQVRICGPTEAVLQSLTFSEKMKAQEGTLSDSFLTFAKKVQALSLRSDGPRTAASLADKVSGTTARSTRQACTRRSH